MMQMHSFHSFHAGAVLKLEDLRAFAAFAAHGSVSRAAQHLHLSQPALTRRIQRLEASLGGKLLDRAAKPPRVSAFGRRVYERAQRVLQEASALRELSRGDAEPSGTFRLGAVQSVSDTVSVEAVRALKSRFPKLRLEMRAELSAELIRQVQLGQLDAAAVMLAPGATLPPEVAGSRVGTQRIFVVAGKDYDGVGPRATLAQLAANPWVLYAAGSCVCRLALQRSLEAQGHQLQVAVSEHGLGHQLALVSAGAGLGCVTEAALETSRHRNRLRRVQVKELDLRFEIWLAHSPHPGALAAPIQCFAQTVGKRFGAAP
jgi:DNA-binding transcriptional LysR family regulator